MDGARDQALDNAIATWVEWSRRERFGRGYPPVAHGRVFVASVDFEGLAESADDVLAAAVDAAMDGLERRLRDALAVRYLGARWWHGGELADALAAARVELRGALRRRGLLD